MNNKKIEETIEKNKNEQKLTFFTLRNERKFFSEKV